MLDVSCPLDLSGDLTTVLKGLFRIVELTQDDLEEGAGVICDFLGAEHG